MTYVSMPNEAFLAGPTVLWNHIDGPLLEWAGHMHWLTWRQRFALWFGRTTVDELACKGWPHLATIRAKLRASA